MSDELTIDSIVSSVESPEKLSDEQRDFLTDHSEELSDDQAKKYGIEKLPAIPDPPEVKDPPEDKDDKEGENDDIDEEDEKKISKIIDKRMEKKMSSFAGEQEKKNRQIEVDQFLGQNPQGVTNVGRYRDKMVKYATHPHYRHLSPSEIFNIIAGPELLRIGARKEREASRRAKETQTNNNSSRPKNEEGKDWSTASSEEFKAKKAAILGRRGN